VVLGDLPPLVSAALPRKSLDAEGNWRLHARPCVHITPRTCGAARQPQQFWRSKSEGRRRCTCVSVSVPLDRYCDSCEQQPA
jgi:hypothetical protein